MTTAIVVENVEEAIRYKNKHPHILDGARLYFPDDSSENLRPKNVNWLYYTDTVGPGCRILDIIKAANTPIPLHI